MKTAIKTLLQRLGGRSDESDFSETIIRDSEGFILRYEDLEIGRLWTESGKWRFEYTDDFRHQSQIKALTDLPNKAKDYEFSDLWPSFQVRIPSLEQPKVREMVESEGIDPTDKAQLLKRFGRQTIANPFILDCA